MWTTFCYLIDLLQYIFRNNMQHLSLPGQKKNRDGGEYKNTERIMIYIGDLSGA